MHRSLADDVLDENFPLAIALDFVGACLFSSGLVLQRYALSSPSAPGSDADSDKVLVFGVALRRNVAWSLGMFTYGSGNAVYTVAMQYAPVSLLTTVFAIALVLNAILSWKVMGETTDANGAVAYGGIMLGIGVSSVGLPKNTAAFSADDMTGLVSQPRGMVYLMVMLGVAAGGAVFVRKFEADFPFAAPKEGESGPGEETIGADMSHCPKKRLLQAQVLFPLVLSNCETLSQLCIKGGSSMLLVTTTGGGNQTGKGMFWVVVIFGVAMMVASVIWLRKCYSRFDTTTMLPIEYGMLTVSTNFGGLLFYEEHKQVSTGDWAWIFVGEVILIVGMVGVTWAKHKQREWDSFEGRDRARVHNPTASGINVAIQAPGINMGAA